MGRYCYINGIDYKYENTTTSGFEFLKEHGVSITSRKVYDLEFFDSSDYPQCEKLTEFMNFLESVEYKDLVYSDAIPDDKRVAWKIYMEEFYTKSEFELEVDQEKLLKYINDTIAEACEEYSTLDFDDFEKTEEGTQTLYEFLDENKMNDILDDDDFILACLVYHISTYNDVEGVYEADDTD
jgi:hypothetical protein